jgi:acyl-CoA synthetase (AMP-forming)/AMP-acid ligase II
MSALERLVSAVLAIDPAAEAIEYQRAWRTWGDVAARVKALGEAYADMGLGDDARVGVLLRNRFEQYCALFSVLGARRCLVTLNPLYPGAVVADDIRAVAPPVVVGETNDLERPEIAEALADLGCGIIAIGDGADPVEVRAPLGPRFSGARNNSGVIIEMLTSGTTGRPKRVPLRREAFEFAFEKTMTYERRSPEDAPKLRSSVQLLTSPFAHIGGVWHAVFQLTAGRKACILEKFELNAWRDAVVRHRPKSSTTPPAALRMILEAHIPKEDLASLMVLTSATAPLDWALVDEVWRRYQIPVLTNYGATEFSGAVAGWSLADFKAFKEAKRGSVGRLQQGVSARVVDPETGAALANGEEGALELKGPQFSTAESDGWVRTTDRAVLDDDNFLWIKGRLDNAIIRGGFKVQPDDIVAALQQHPAVREAAVVGVPDERLGEAPHAAIIVKVGAHAPDKGALDQFLRARLAPYQVPVRYHVMEDFPRTASLKPALAALREKLKAAAV